MSIIGWTNRDLFDPFFGLTDVLGDYDRQMRRMQRDFNRLENQLVGERNADFPLELSSLTDRSAIVPRILDKEGNKLAQYNFDIKGFRPEDVNIKTTADGRLVVSARHEDRSDDYHAVREFHRMVTMPEGLQVVNMKSRLHNGVLSIEAPYVEPKQLQQQQQQQAIQGKGLRELPIEHEKLQGKSIQ